MFFFQAEDGIRDWSVTGVQTCALPISREGARRGGALGRLARLRVGHLRGGGGLFLVEARAQRFHEVDDLREIGRASCRERGENLGSAGASKKGNVSNDSTHKSSTTEQE